MAASSAERDAPPLEDIDIGEGTGEVSGVIDNNHRRSRGLVGQIARITSAYYGEQYRRENPAQFWNFRVVAFVPGRFAADDQ